MSAPFRINEMVVTGSDGELTWADYVRADIADGLLEALECFVDATMRDVVCVKPSDRDSFLQTLSLASAAIAKAKGEQP